jgi:hypothetical protein
MTLTPHRLESYLATAMAGSLIGQIASAREIPFHEMFAADETTSSPAIRAIATELDELGIDAVLLASQALCALVALFAQEQNADLITSHYTALLWSILGDPENGGSPPEIYRRAGCAMHLTLLGILDPSITEKRPSP